MESNRRESDTVSSINLYSFSLLFIHHKQTLDQQLKKFAYGGVNLQDISNEYYKQFSIELDIDKLSICSST